MYEAIDVRAQVAYGISLRPITSRTRYVVRALPFTVERSLPVGS